MNIVNRTIALLFVCLFPLAAFSLSPAAQTVTAVTRISPYRQPVFYVLAITVIVLLGCIFQLQKTTVEMVRYGKFKRINLRVFSWTISLMIALILPDQVAAAGLSHLSENENFGLGCNAFNALAFLIAFEFAVIMYYIRKIHQLMFFHSK